TLVRGAPRRGGARHGQNRRAQAGETAGSAAAPESEINMPATADFKDTQQLLIHLLTDHGVLDLKKLEVLREAQAKESGSIEHVLIKKELASERDIAHVYADYLALPLFESVGEGVNPTLGR